MGGLQTSGQSALGPVYPLSVAPTTSTDTVFAEEKVAAIRAAISEGCEACDDDDDDGILTLSIFNNAASLPTGANSDSASGIDANEAAH